MASRIESEVSLAGIGRAVGPEEGPDLARSDPAVKMLSGQILAPIRPRENQVSNL
jgi:hypothetical protein